jgi:hypothetical protein
MQGQRSHLAQAKKCHEKWQADLDTLHIPSSKGCRDDEDPTEGVDDVLNADHRRNADGPYIPEPADDPYIPELPADETPVLEERHQDEDHPSSKHRWRDHFPHLAGQGIRREPTAFELLRNAQVARGETIWGMFLDEGDWDFAWWILKSGTTHASTDELLELKKVSRRFVIKYMTYQSIADSRRQLRLIPQ